jgi:fructoselysine-6-P-deglycase FrlB-like protein
VSFAAAEIASQPECWQRAAEVSADAAVAAALPAAGERVAVVGCGTSLYMAQACAAYRERGGWGETDAFAASEFPGRRRYDRVVAITRSGTTTEVVRLLQALSGLRTTVVTTGTDLPAANAASMTIALEFADERSVVQTRFATTALALWRAHLGANLAAAIEDARAECGADLEPAWFDKRQFTFVGTGWTVGIAAEAALKLREAAQAWTESYPAMEVRHGPISVLGAHSLAWVFGDPPSGLLDDLAATGATVVSGSRDPMAALIRAQRLAVALAESKSLDPDRPRNLTRSIVLSGS